MIESERGKFEADSLVYDLSSSSGVLKAARFAADPFYGQAEKLSRDKDIFLLENGYITTCNLARPHYRFACQRVEFKPGSYLKTGPARLILGEKLTVFYLPGWTYNLKTEKSPVSIIPGYRTSTGAGWFLTIAFNQTLVKDSDLTLSENLHLQRKAAGAGLNLESRERHLKSETLIVKKWRESEPDYGGIAEFQFSPPGKEEKLYFLADWRWMKNNNFFYDYFHETFLEKSRRYNYLSFTEALGSGWMNLQIRERARESILTVEQLPGFRFFLPLLPVGESPVYLSNDLEVGHFEVDGKESVRVVNSTTVEAGENIGVFKVKPWMSFSALEYTGSGSEIFRHPVELGLKISTLLARDLKHRYQEQLIPSLVLINRSFLSPEPDLPVYDNYELLTSGRFAGFDLDWNLWRQDTWMGHASVRSLYDLGRQKFADTVFNYELHPTGRVAFTGTNIWDFSEGSYRFGVNDVSVEGKGYRCSVGVRYQEKEVTGLESW
ncbi:MAG TPA: hypothetical protein PK644_08970, partial [bacterium]|nr:hypothetical protein [bacterium]